MIFTQHHIKVILEGVGHFERGAVVLHNLKAKAGLGRIGYEGDSRRRAGTYGPARARWYLLVRDVAFWRARSRPITSGEDPWQGHG